MKSVRCSICRQKYKNSKKLNFHYMRKHSKMKIVKELLTSNVLLSTPKVLHKKYKYMSPNKKTIKKIKMDPNSANTETLFMNEDIHILCGQNEIIIGDGKSSVDLEFSFDETSCETKENHTSTIPKNSKSYKKRQSSNSDYCSRSPSASSEGSNISLEKNKRKIKRKRQSLGKFKHYRINISKLENQQSLDDQTGEFYICLCREKSDLQRKSLEKSNLRIITSDTETCSDAGKNYFIPIVDTKVFCKKCGNGYKTQQELTEHMYIHETFCRLCNTSFPSEYSFREHMRLHIFKVFMCHICNAEFLFRDMLMQHFEYHMEDRTFENVLDMEEEYHSHRYSFMNMNYNSSINNILCFLNENHDVCFCSCRYTKIVCNICWNEVYFCDYERHLQTVHYCYTC